MAADNYPLVVDKGYFLEGIFDLDSQGDILVVDMSPVVDTLFVVDTEVDIGVGMMVDTVPAEVDIGNLEVADVCFIKLEQLGLLVHILVDRLAEGLLRAFQCFIIARKT